MGDRPSKNHSIDRIDNDKGYFKENCRWATRSEQNKNWRKIGRYSGLEIDGVRQSLRDWEKVSPISRAIISKRLKEGMTAKEAVFSIQKPNHFKLSKDDRIEIQKLFSEGKSIASIARKFKVDPSTAWHSVHGERKPK